MVIGEDLVMDHQEAPLRILYLRNMKISLNTFQMVSITVLLSGEHSSLFMGMEVADQVGM